MKRTLGVLAMSKRYIIAPGNVKSVSDGDIHYISADKLIQLYNVNPLECVVYEPARHKTLKGYTQEQLDGMQWLSPSMNGNYNLTERERNGNE